jgi:hypothetical protein
VEPSDRGESAQRGVGTMVVVVVRLLLEQLDALFVARVGPDVRPFIEQGAVEALHLAMVCGR